MTRHAVASVFHIIESLNRGAVENWLVRMLKHARRRGVQTEWTFYCALGREGALRKELIRVGPEVMHCHHDLVSAVYLVAATGLGIQRRLVHAHNADEHLPTSSGLKRRLGLAAMRHICLAADRIVGISNHTLDTMLGGGGWGATLFIFMVWTSRHSTRPRSIAPLGAAAFR